MTTRDKDILVTVYQFRLMTREQIEKLLFASSSQDHFTKTSQVRRRLKLLYHHGYLERIPAPTSPGYWAWRPVYRLGKKGAEIISAEIGTSPEDIEYWGQGFDKDSRQTQVSFLFLSHALKINDVRIRFLLSARASGFQVENWITDTDLKSRNQKAVRAPIIPDSYFVLNLGDRTAPFFLELDLATMTAKRWQDKVGRYKKFVETGKYEAHYHTRSLRILTVTTSPERLTNLKKATEQIGGNLMFWFTTIEQISESDVLLSPVWQIAGQTNSSPLIF